MTHPKTQGWLVCLSGLFCAVPLSAAPLDALLEASPQNRHGDAMLEIAMDGMNKRLDVFSLRSTDTSLPDNAGDYNGAQIRGGLQVHPGFWLEGGLMRRNIRYSTYHPQIDSWQLAGQWQILKGHLDKPDVDVRLSAWGNRSGVISRNQTESVTIGSQSVDIQTLSLSNVQDQQAQLDLISTWRWTDTTASLFAGAGVGRVKVGAISVQSSLGALTYSDNFSTLFQALLPTYARQLDALDYSTRFVHSGVNMGHRQGRWSLRAGYNFFVIDRTKVDDVIARLPEGSNRGFRVNHTLVGEAAYRVSPAVSVFARGQVMSNQFLADVPMLYNSITARRFNEKYGLVSVGMRLSF
jgi:hypothetical protein